MIDNDDIRGYLSEIAKKRENAESRNTPDGGGRTVSPMEKG